MPKQYEDMTMQELALEYKRLKKVLARKSPTREPRMYSIVVNRMAHVHRLFDELKRKS